MDQLFAPLRQLQARFLALSPGLRMAIMVVGVIVGLVVVVAQLGNSAGHYEYAFTNLSAEDSAEAATQLKSAKIAFRMEAGGTALSVPASQVYDARLLLAGMGLPRGGGVGFEIFDRGDLGVSDFTQRVNLRRAIEGELGRTISRLAAVRSARVHVTLPEKGLYRDEDRRATAAVVLNLQPGRTMADKELSGVRHLVSSAVTGLNPENVSVMDGRGTVLAGDTSTDSKAATQQHDVERSLEQRITGLLEPAVGAGAVIAKVTATFDSADVETTADAFDPDATAIRSEHKTTEQTVQDSGGASGVAGAAANVPGAGVPGGGGTGNKGSTMREDETRNFEISKTITRTVSHGPRLRKLSVAVLLESPEGKPRPDSEVARLADLAKSAVGYDAKRGDQFQISSSAFVKAPEAGEVPAEAWWMQSRTLRLAQLVGGFVLVLLVLFAVVKMKGRAPLTGTYSAAMLKPGSKVGEIEAAMANNGNALVSATPGAVALPASGDPNAQVRDRARELAAVDPQRAAHLLRAWINTDNEEGKRA